MSIIVFNASSSSWEEVIAIMSRDEAGYHSYRWVARYPKGKISSGTFDLAKSNTSSLRCNTIKRHGWLLGRFRNRAHRKSEGLLRTVSAEQKNGIARGLWSGKGVVGLIETMKHKVGYSIMTARLQWYGML